MSSSPAVAPEARLTFQDAFDRIKSTVSDHDARQFQSTELKDVRDGALDLEARLGERKSLRNMRRIKPFLDGLERYSSAVDVLCNGTPFLPWIWAPVKLILELASGFEEGFELLISAYKDIAQTLPRFDRLSAAFKAEPDFQHVLAIFYADIVEFHRRSYQFVRRKGWRVFFLSSWTRFESRFKNILTDLAKHSELVDKEAASFAIAEAREWRERWNEQISKQELDRANSQLKAAIAWLDVEKWDYEHENELCRLSGRCQPGSCDWIFANTRMKTWIRQGPQQSLMWMRGKPGSGKSVLCSKIIESLQETSNNKVFYYFCSFSALDGNMSARIFRSLAAQALRANPEPSSWMYDKFISRNLIPSLAQLRILLPTLLSTIPSTRIVLDGVDELEANQQKSILSEIVSLLGNKGLGEGSCKILVSSRDVPQISRALGRRSQISLNEEQQAISGAIQNFVENSVNDLQSNLDEISMEGDAMTGIRQALVDKAEGMFLWVHLVVTTLENIYSITEMQQAVNTLPKGLDEIYNRIWCKIESQLDEKGRSTVSRIFEWIAFGERPLKKHEVQDGVTLHHENTIINENTHISRNVFDLCKPLLEDGPHDTIRFVHSSVKEYLLAHKSRFERGLMPHYDIAFACTSYLIMGLTLVDPDYDENQRLIDVGKGLHGLQLYANEFWLEHILTYADLASGDRNTLPASKLLSALQAFVKKQMSIWTRINLSEQKNLQKQKLEALDSRVDSFQDHENIHSTVVRLSTFRRALSAFPSNQSSAATRNDVDTLGDPTLFTSMLHKYNSLVQHLSKISTMEGLSATRLAAFKQIYGSSAFLCRIRGCPRASHGFEADRERLEHEKTHELSLYCNDLSCEYNKLGFITARALKKHMLKCHPVTQRRVPESLQKEKSVRENLEGSESDMEERTEDEDGFAPVDDLGFPSELIPATKYSDLTLEKEDSFALATTSWYTARD